MQASTRLPLGDFLAEANRWEELWSSFLDWEWQVGAWDFFEDQVPLWEYVRVPVFLKLQRTKWLYGIVVTRTQALDMAVSRSGFATWNVRCESLFCAVTSCCLSGYCSQIMARILLA
jgi:hypothetical protein